MIFPHFVFRLTYMEIWYFFLPCCSQSDVRILLFYMSLVLHYFTTAQWKNEVDPHQKEGKSDWWRNYWIEHLLSLYTNTKIKSLSTQWLVNRQATFETTKANCFIKQKLFSSIFHHYSNFLVHYHLFHILQFYFGFWVFSG